MTEPNESVAEISSGSSSPTDPGQVDGEPEQVRARRERRHAPVEGQREVELVCRVGVLGQRDDGVLEVEEHPRVDLEGEVQVDRAAAALLGVQVDLPELAQRVRLDEVPLVVHVEAVIHGMVLELCHIPSDVDDCHRRASLYGRRRRTT